MIEKFSVLAVAGAVLMAMLAAAPVSAQKPGGILKIGQFDSPASMSIHEESSNVAEGPMMGSSITSSSTIST
jgi:hypothetical protein